MSGVSPTLSQRILRKRSKVLLMTGSRKSHPFRRGTQLAILLAALPFAPAGLASAQAPAPPYPTMAPFAQYLMTSSDAEIALARSAAPASISDHAEVMVLGLHGYTTAVQGTNGFLCIVERSWGAATSFAEFWNPHIRAPICFNPAAARSYVPIYLLKTSLVLAGNSKPQIATDLAAAFASHKLPPLAPGAMCYMMSPHQYLNDEGKTWHPHLMFFVQGQVASAWGADLPGSPIMSAPDPEEHVTIFMVFTADWANSPANSQ